MIYNPWKERVQFKENFSFRSKYREGALKSWNTKNLENFYQNDMLQLYLVKLLTLDNFCQTLKFDC